MAEARRREEEGAEGRDTQMRVKYNRLLHGSNRTTSAEPLTTAFLKKYIRYAKSRYRCGGPATPAGPHAPCDGCHFAPKGSNQRKRAERDPRRGGACPLTPECLRL